MFVPCQADIQSLYTSLGLYSSCKFINLHVIFLAIRFPCDEMGIKELAIFLTNKELYDQVQKLKAKPAEVVYVNVEVPYPVHDTTFLMPTDTNYIKQTFDFSDKWRALSGYIEYNKPNLGLTIDKDIVYADLTVAIKDSKVYVTSNNPYLQYNNIQGVVLPKTTPRWSIGVGPQVGIGYGFINKKPDVYVGVGLSINYNLVSFGKKVK